ncbi:MAG: hypothetical protein WC878_03990 [Candidatus Paceibacterota bacterium]|jgi:hypothetical protein
MSDKTEDEKIAIVRRLGARVQKDIDAMPKTPQSFEEARTEFLAELSKCPSFNENKNKDSV